VGAFGASDWRPANGRQATSTTTTTITALAAISAASSHGESNRPS
jgi:hypothetical protein